MKPHIPRKRFGQHFLHDKLYIQQIIEAIDPKPDQHLVEIGPGQGALTLPMLKKTEEIDVIELDWDLIPALKIRCLGKGALIAHQADALEFDFSSLVKNSEKLRIIGNLPYNISTPLIFHLLKYASIITDMHFMLQKEVVDRMSAKPSTKEYGRLSVMVQYHCVVHALFNVPPQAFYPPPQVESAFLRLIPATSKHLQAIDYSFFAEVVKTAFSHRRKTIRNSLKTLIADDDWANLQIDPQLRPEQLTVIDFVNISNFKSEHL